MAREPEELVEMRRVLGGQLAAFRQAVGLVKELRTARTGMQPWQGTRAVEALDDQLVAYGPAPNSATG